MQHVCPVYQLQSADSGALTGERQLHRLFVETTPFVTTLVVCSPVRPPDVGDD